MTRSASCVSVGATEGSNPDEAVNSNGFCVGAVEATMEAVNPDAGVTVLDGDETITESDNDSNLDEGVSTYLYSLHTHKPRERSNAHGN